MSIISTYIRRCLYICAALLALCGCNERLQPIENGDATLKLVLNAPTSGLELKSVSSDPDSPEKWTQWERAVDGRYLYRVTAFILQGNRLVAHKDIELEDEAQEAVLDFEANFTHGSYTLMVVANYSAHQAADGSNGTRRYEGIQDFTGTVENLLKQSMIDNFTNLYSDSFLNYKIKSDGGVCPRVPQPLTLVKAIELHPGVNNIYGELLRTYSRVRIAVENNSDEELKISSLSFSDIFTQNSAYIFADKGYVNDKAAITVNSVNAMTPFTGTDSAPMLVKSKETAVVFDAYILESQKNATSGTYTYSLGLGYENLNLYILKSTTAINSNSNVKRGHYLIYNANGSTYLKAGTSSVTTGSPGTLKAGMTLPEGYVWTFDNTKSNNSTLSANQYYIGTAAALESGQTAYYMNTPSSSSVTLGSNKSVYYSITNKNSSLSMQSSGNGNYRYLSVNNGSVLGQRRNNDSNALFVLYPVDVASEAATDIPLKTIDSSTGQSAEVTEIRRNDFINAVVKVSYSKNQGHFTYEVHNWGSAGGDVSFN